MSALSISQTITFHTTQLGVCQKSGQLWVSLADIAHALGYQNHDKLGQIFQRYRDEFNGDLTTLERIQRGKRSTTVRLFNRRGAWLLAMFSRTPVAKEFRKWVLDVLEDKQKALPAPADALSGITAHSVELVYMNSENLRAALDQIKLHLEAMPYSREHYNLQWFLQQASCKCDNIREGAATLARKLPRPPQLSSYPTYYLA